MIYYTPFIYTVIFYTKQLPDKVNDIWLKIVEPSRYYPQTRVFLSTAPVQLECLSAVSQLVFGDSSVFNQNFVFFFILNTIRGSTVILLLLCVNTSALHRPSSGHFNVINDKCTLSISSKKSLKSAQTHFEIENNKKGRSIILFLGHISLCLSIFNLLCIKITRDMLTIVYWYRFYIFFEETY